MEEVDVLVVGGGLLGFASAYHIKSRDRASRVLLVDRYGAPGQGNTGRSNAMFRNTFSSKDNQILSDSSINFYLDVQERSQEDIGLQQIGYLWLMDESRLSSSEKYLQEMARNGVETRKFGQARLRALLSGLAPDGTGGAGTDVLRLPKVDWGIFGPKCGRLDPDKLVRYYAKMFTALGGKVGFNTEAERLVPGPRERLGIGGEPLPWQEWSIEEVELRGGVSGRVKPGTVVLACGAWGNELLGPLGIDGHVKAKKRQLFSVPSTSKGLGDLLRTKEFNKFGLLPMTILPKAGVHFKPVSEEGAFWVGCEDEVGRPFIESPDRDLSVYGAEPEYFQKGIKPVLAGYFPAFEGATVKAMWAGLYSYNTTDYLPFVFRENNLIAVGGDSGSGIMKGDSLGRIVAATCREEDQAVLFGGHEYSVSKLGFRKRDVEREEWVL